MPTWLGCCHVSATMSPPTSRMPISCHRMARTDSTKRGQPASLGLMAVLRGPVIQPVRKLSSFQPQASSAQVKAQ